MPACRRRAPTTDRNGFALIAVLWALVLLSALTAAFSAGSRTHANLAYNLVAQAQAEALADAAVHRVAAALLQPPEGGRYPLQVDGSPYAWFFADGEVLLYVEDEGGKIDLNVASKETLGTLFSAVGTSARTATAIAEAIIDFRDEDDEAQPSGAELKEYRAAGMSGGPKNAPFDFVEELQGVMFMNRELYRLVAPILTVHALTETPNAALTPLPFRDLVAAVTEQAASQRVGGAGQRRKRLDGAAALARESEAAAEQLRRVETLSVPPDGLVPLVPGTDDSDPSGVDVYKVHAEARSTGGGVFVREAIVAINTQTDQPFEVRDWRRGRRELLQAAPGGRR